jgi:hypothetical protein
MPTIAIDDTFAGTVVATNGVLQSITVVGFPANSPWEQPQYGPGTGLATVGCLTLADNSFARLRTLFNVDGNGVGLLTIGHKDWSKPAVISSAPTPFNSLLVAAVPKGSRFSLEIV